MKDLTKLKSKLESHGLTPFSIQVLLETARIPKGETRSYAEIAKAVGRPKAARAVGSALRRNPVPGNIPGVHVPCHRVIHSDGRIEGFMGSLAKGSKENLKKCQLLRLEGAV